MKNKWWWMASLLLVLALVGQYAIYTSEKPGMRAHASWHETPANFEEVRGKAREIVEAQVLAVEAGEPLITQLPAGHPPGWDQIPTQRIRIQVQSRDKGQLQPGQEVTVFRTGGELQLPATERRGPPDPRRGHVRADPPAGEKNSADPNAEVGQSPEAPADPEKPPDATGHALMLDEDPPYQVGERVFLALTDGPANTLRPVAPAGRYRINQSNRLEAVSDDPVSQSLHGRDLAQAKAAARGELQIPTQARGQPQRRVTTGEPGTQPGMPRTGHAHDPMDKTQILLLSVAAAGMVVAGVSLIARRRRA